MKQLYVCERCGAQYITWDEAYNCERSHLSVEVVNRCNLAEADDELMEMIAHYKPRCPLPDSITVMYRPIDPDTNEFLTEDGVPVYRTAVYSFASKQPSSDLERLNASIFKRQQEDAEYYEEWRRKREEDAAKEEE